MLQFSSKEHLFNISNLKGLFQKEICSTIFRVANNSPNQILKVQAPLDQNWKPLFQAQIN
jgi:hypothetical protein